MNECRHEEERISSSDLWKIRKEETQRKVFRNHIGRQMTKLKKVKLQRLFWTNEKRKLKKNVTDKITKKFYHEFSKDFSVSAFDNLRIMTNCCLTETKRNERRKFFSSQRILFAKRKTTILRINNKSISNPFFHFRFAYWFFFR